MTVIEAVEPRTLKEVKEKLDARRRELSNIFTEYPNLDMTAEVAQDIKARNDELTDLGKRYDELVDLEAIRQDVRKHAPDLAEVKTVADDGRGNRDRDREHDLRRLPGGADDEKTLGQLFIESSAYKNWAQVKGSNRISSAEVRLSPRQLKATLTTTGYAPESTRIGPILPGVLRRPRVADLIPQGVTRMSAIKYMEETTTTNAIAPTAEGAAKPEITLAFTERTSNVRKVAGMSKMTDESLEDTEGLQSYVETRMRLFLQLSEEDQLLNGDGNAPNLLGIYNLPSILTQAKGADPTPDAFYKAMVQIQTTSFLEPSAHVMHPLDWQDIRLLRTADGIYIWGSPADVGPERMWGLPVVSTSAATQNTGLVAAWDTALMIYRRQEVQFDIATQNEDDWKKNIVALRIEERLALVAYRQTGVAKVTGI